MILEDFNSSSFTTVGLATYQDPSDSSKLYIHVISLPPSSACFGLSTPSFNPFKFLSILNHLDPFSRRCTDSPRIEIFLHNPLDTSSPPRARHIRTIAHKEIYTPNDILVLGVGDFLVSNDHYFKFGLMRLMEDLLNLKWMSLTNVVRVRVDLGMGVHQHHVAEAEEGQAGDSHAVSVEKVLQEVHNANGLCWGPDFTIALSDASGGVVRLYSYDKTERGSQMILQDHFSIPTGLDNPTYFKHPTNDSKSGYILAGLTRGIDLSKTARDENGMDPWVVWRVRQGEDGGRDSDKDWKKEKLAEDNGKWLRSASTALIISDSSTVGSPLRDDDSVTRQEEEGWLVVAGLFSRGLGVLRVLI
jgi:hypothetical protein